jgi:membrane peptidoglycan carboxypeptidase
MELYLNVIEFGPMVYGIGPAANHYFHTSPGQLSLGQALYLASILSNPKQQHFGSGGAVTPKHMGYLRTLMKIVHKIKRVSDEELERGLRETVVFGSPAPVVSLPEDEEQFPENPSAPDPLEQSGD